MNKLAFLAAYMRKEAESEEQIEGGKADGMDTQDLAEKQKVAPKEIEQQKQEGTAVELEHTDKPAVAEEVAEDHLEEIPDYYDRLGDMEEEAKVEKEKDLGDPSPVDKEIIMKFISSQPDLDDETMHSMYTSLGVDPHEGEEIIYSALQQYMQNNPSGLAPAYIKEREVEKGEEEKEASEIGKEAGMIGGTGRALKSGSKNLWKLLSGKKLAEMQNKAKNMPGLGVAPPKGAPILLKKPVTPTIQDMQKLVDRTAKAQTAARVGVGAAGVAGTGYLFGGNSE